MKYKIKNDEYDVELDLSKDYGTLWHDKCTEHTPGTLQDEETLTEIHDILDNFTDEDVFIDCGAHVGMMSILLKKGTVYAIEPNPETFKKLINNIRLNKKERIFAVNGALYDSEINYCLNVGMPTGMTNVIKINEQNSPKTMIGDKLFKDILNIRLIKIDCENATPNVLNGLKEIIKRDKPVLIIEVGYQQVAETMKELNYRLLKQIENNKVWISL